MGLENPIHFARGQSLNEERGRLIATMIGQQALGPISYYGRFQWSLFCDFCEISRHVYALSDTCGVLYCLRFFTNLSLLTVISLLSLRPVLKFTHFW